MFHGIQTNDFFFLGNSQTYSGTDNKEGDSDCYYGPCCHC